MKFINIASLLALLTVFDYSSSVGILATAKTSTYETEYEISTTEYEWENDDETKGDPIPKPEENIPSLPTTRHLRGAKDAVVNQFLSDGDGDSERELFTEVIYYLSDGDEDSSSPCGGDFEPCSWYPPYKYLTP